MSDSYESAISFMSNCKLRLAIFIPCCAVGFGVMYYYYSRMTNGNKIQANENAVKKIRTKRVKELKKFGDIEYTFKNHNAAIDFYTQALFLCPEDKKGLLSILYQNRAAAYSKLNNNENCIADCNKALELVPMYKKALSRRSKAHSKLENFKLALEDITALILLDDSENEKYLIYENNVLECLGKKNLEEYQKHNIFNLPTKTYIENYIYSFSDDPFNDEFPQSLMLSDVNTGLELALKCLRDQMYEEIEDACQEELNKADNNLIRRSLALNLFATFSILRGKCDIGIEHLTTIIETPGTPTKIVVNSLIKRALEYQQQEQVEKSFEDLKRAENIDPNSSDVFHQRAQIYLTENDNEKAVEEYKKAIELNPNFILSNIICSYVQYIHAKNMSNELDAEKNIKILEEFVIKYPNYTESYLLYAKVLETKGLFDEADMLLKKVLTIYPENATILVQRAVLAVTWKTSISDTIDLLEQALQIDPKCSDAYEILMLIYFKTGMLKEAIECSENVIRLSTSKKELLRMFLFRDSLKAKLEVTKRLGLKMKIE